MEFENSNKLKGYLNNESKRLNIHCNYAYTYYFLRSFLERLLKNNQETFVLKGSTSQLASTHNFIRPITDLDIISYLDLQDSAEVIQTTIAHSDDIKFSLKEKFITTNDTANFRILCNFGAIEHLIKIDLKKETPFTNVNGNLPIIFSKDKQLPVRTITIEQHIANKIYIILKNMNLYIEDNKAIRRFKDFYDLHFLLQSDKYDNQLVNELLEKNMQKYGNLKYGPNILNKFNENFIKENNDTYLAHKKQFGFQEISLETLIDSSKDEILRRF